MRIADIKERRLQRKGKTREQMITEGKKLTGKLTAWEIAKIFNFKQRRKKYTWDGKEVRE